MSDYTFPALTDAERALFDLHLAAITRVARPGLCDLLLSGEMNDLPVVESGKIKNAAWRTLHADAAMTYTDESVRGRAAGASQVETVRAYLKRINTAYEEAFGEAFPVAAVALTVGDDPTTVDLWRTA